MNKFLSILLLAILLLIAFPKSSYAIYNPLSVSNNKFGIHILFPDEISDAAHLVNSKGGDWGYVTIPIRASEKDLVKWQTFMDSCAKFHIIPIVRIATEGDYFVQGSWSKPNKYDLIDFANFLNSLDWPTKNRYVIIYNEPNRADEWGGAPNAYEYSDILNAAVDIFKERSDKFFIISAGLDNAAANVTNKSVDEFTYMQQMNDQNPGIFARIDGLSVHAYPNPGFSTPPNDLGPGGVNSFSYDVALAQRLSGKTLPVFITETGWTSDVIPQSVQGEYYKIAFSNVWNNANIVAITPFIFHADTPPFKQFSFIIDNNKTHLYNVYAQIPKQKGKPQVERKTIQTVAESVVLKTKYFTNEVTKTLEEKIDKNTKHFFKWLLNVR